MEVTRINNDFSYHAPDAGKVVIHESIREMCRNLALELNQMLPEGREKSLAITHLEEVMMWANASIARNT